MNPDRHPAYYPYLYSVGAVGFALLVISVARLITGKASYEWIFLGIITVLTSAFPIKIPAIDFKISIEDTFFYTNLVLFGPEAGVVTAALQGIMGSVRIKSAKRRLEFMLFNTGALVLAGFVSGHLFFFAYQKSPVYGHPPEDFKELVLPLSILALVHYLLNSISVATILSLDSRRKMYGIWRRNFSWTWVTYVAGVLVSAFIALTVSSASLTVLVAASPIVLITWFAFRTYRDKIESQIQQFQQLNNLYLRTVESLALAVDAKDQSTHGHIRRVCAYSEGLAQLLKITEKNELLAIKTGALLHDIGKLAVEDYILTKPGKLTAAEFEQMKVHTTAGEEILKQIDFPFPVAKYVRSHHERWDGKGYPDGLRGEDIPGGARILAISDAYDAMRSARPYKKPRSSEEAVRELEKDAGSHFDPAMVGMFVQHIKELEASAEEAVAGMPELSFHSKPKPDGLPSTGVVQNSGSLEDGVFGELVSFCEFCSSVAQGLSLDDILVNLELRLKRLVPFDCCIIYLLQENKTIRAGLVGGRFADQLSNRTMEVGKGISGWVAAYRTPMVNTSPGLDFQDLDINVSCLSDTLVVPIRQHDVCLGTISLYAAKPVRYSEAHLGIVQIVGNQIAPMLADALCKAKKTPDALDTVTGLPKVAYLAAAGAQLIERCGCDGSTFHLVHLRIKNMAQLVELYGPPVRDWILHRAAKVLIGEIRQSDVATRYGRDGFVLLMPGVKPGQLFRRVQRVTDLISAIQLQDGSAVVCEVGSACYPQEGTSIFTLLDAAQHSTLDLAKEIGSESESKVLDFPA